MNDNPRTGKQAINSNLNGKRMADRVGADFACELERENARLRDALRLAIHVRGTSEDTVEVLRVMKSALLPNVKDEGDV
jgi:hypothetical protein